MTKKCICFSRVSSSRQDLDAQRVAIKNAALKEYKQNEIIEVSGKESAIKLDEMERQTLNEMKELAAENPSIESIYFFAVDRLARRVSVVMSIKEWADERKINLVFLNPYPFSTWFSGTDGTWKKNEISDIYLMFLGFGAKMEMEIKNERFANAKAFLRSQNKPTGKILFGYTTDENKNLIIDKVKAPIIRWMFDCCIKKGMSTAQIFEEGVDLGYWKNLNTRSSKTNHIRFYLANYAYAGRTTKGGLTYPAIVEEWEIDKAIGIMAAKRNLPKHTRHEYLCKSIIKDETTEKAMIADFSHLKYVLRNENDKSVYGVNINVCDSLIWMTAFETKWNLLSHADDNQIDATKKQMAEVSAKIANLKSYVESEISPKYTKAYNAYINSRGRITETMYNNTINDLDAEHKTVTKKIETLEKRETELFNVLNELENKEKRDISIYTLKEIADDTQRREIIEECVTDMTVKKVDTRKYIINVFHVLPTSPNTYIYIPLGGSNKVYHVIGDVDDLENLNIENALTEGRIIDVTSEIEKRFGRKRYEK